MRSAVSPAVVAVVEWSRVSPTVPLRRACRRFPNPPHLGYCRDQATPDRDFGESEPERKHRDETHELQ